MRSFVFVVPLVVLSLAVGVVTARVIAPPPAAMRVAAADAVVVGKVLRFADRLAPVGLMAGDTTPVQIAHVTVESALLGKPGKEVRVGFVPSPGNPRGRRYGAPQLTIGQEACLFLTRHPTQKNLFVLRYYYDVLPRSADPEFAKQLAEIKRAATILTSPLAALKAKDPADRYEAAALLLTRYRQLQPGERTEAVPAEESKRILEALTGIDWEKVPPRFYRMHPRMLFGQLGLTAKDGWTPPKDFMQFSAQAKKWLQTNAGTYRLTRFTLEKGPEPAPAP